MLHLNLVVDENQVLRDGIVAEDVLLEVHIPQQVAGLKLSRNRICYPQPSQDSFFLKIPDADPSKLGSCDKGNALLFEVKRDDLAHPSDVLVKSILFRPHYLVVATSDIVIINVVDSKLKLADQSHVAVFSRASTKEYGFDGLVKDKRFFGDNSSIERL